MKKYIYIHFFSSELQALNDDTVDKLYQNQLNINKNRRSLLQDRAGVAPRLYHFDINTVS